MISRPASLRACQDRCSIISLARGGLGVYCRRRPPEPRSPVPGVSASISNSPSNTRHRLSPLPNRSSLTPRYLEDRRPLRRSTPYIFTCQSITLPRSPQFALSHRPCPGALDVPVPPRLPYCPYRPWPVSTPQLRFIVSSLTDTPPQLISLRYPSYPILFPPFPVLHSVHSPHYFCCDFAVISPAHTGLQTDY
ncbi:hypothetical protein BDW71DRAFT_73639 [Aspergillus fruticulosus]